MFGKRISMSAAVVTLAAALVWPAVAHAQGGAGVTVGPGGEVGVFADTGNASPGNTGNAGTGNAGNNGASAPSQPQYQNYDAGPSACELATAAGNLCSAIERAPIEHAQAAPAPVVDPLTVAQSVATGMQIQPIEIGMAPELVKGVARPVGLIGLPIWWWVANPNENTVGPITRTATTGALTVNVTAVNTSIVFGMTDGGPPMPCAPHATIPYTEAFMGTPSPVCGRPTGAIRTSIHDPGGTFTVTATSLWVVTWSAIGPGIAAGGTFPMTPTATGTARFGEVQVLTGGG